MPGKPTALVLDGRFHTTPHGLFGFRHAAATLKGSRLTILMTGGAPGYSSEKTYKFDYVLLADGDLCHTDHTIERWDRFSRRRGRSRAAEDKAFLRSVEPCSVRQVR
jgi:hypothetical protein